MKKKRKRIVLIVILLALCFPIRSSYKDGGTVSYTSLLYQVRHVHSLEDDTVRGEFVNTEGLRVHILGFLPVYDSCLLTKWTNGKAEKLPTLPRGETGVLYILDDGGTLRTYMPADTPDDLGVKLWLSRRKNGCALDVQDPVGKDYAHFVLAVGEDVTLWLEDMEAPRAYRFYYAAEDAPLPAAWNDVTVQAERAEAERAAFGTFEAFATARDREAELETICVLLPEKAQPKAESWYEMLLEGLWVNGDVSVTFTDGYRDDQLSDWTEVVLQGDDGRTYRLQGNYYFGTIRAVFRDEKLYYGLLR